MNRYFDLPDTRNTLMIKVEAGSPAALARPEQIAEHFLKQGGTIREVEYGEYARLQKLYTSPLEEGEKE